MSAESNLKIHVLFRCSKKTGKIDMTMTSMGSAMMRLWAMRNTPASKMCLIFERESGKLVFAVHGLKEGGFQVKSEKECEGTCDDYGIPLEELHAVKDDRWD